MHFIKMQGCGNDYVFIDCMKKKWSEQKDKATFARRICDDSKGVGADGVIFIHPPSDSEHKAHASMEIYNADGSSAKMCGNGLRCVMKYLYDKKIVQSKEVIIRTASGLKNGIITDKGVKVDMGEPVTRTELIPVKGMGPKVIGRTFLYEKMSYEATCISMGNPHLVLFHKEEDLLQDKYVCGHGKSLEKDSRFPERINVEFVKVIERKTIEMRVWERGSGETMACGTGACAAVCACILQDFTGTSVTVNMKGGSLFISYDHMKDTIYMEGEAIYVFEGEYLLDGGCC